MNQSSNVLGHGEFGSIRTTRRKNIVIKTFNKEKNRNKALQKSILGMKYPDNISSYVVPLHTNQLIMKRLGISVKDVPEFVPIQSSFPFTTMKPLLQAIQKLCKQIMNFSDHSILHRDIHPGNIMIGAIQQNSIVAPSYPLQEIDLFLIDPDLLLFVPDLFLADAIFNQYTIPPEWMHVLTCNACRAAILTTIFTAPPIMPTDQYIKNSRTKLGISELDFSTQGGGNDSGYVSSNYILNKDVQNEYVTANDIVQNRYVTANGIPTTIGEVHEALQNPSNREEMVHRLCSTYDEYGLGKSLLELFAKLFKNVSSKEWNQHPNEKNLVESCTGIFQAMSHPNILQRPMLNDIVRWIGDLSMTIGGRRRSKVNTRRRYK
jgi:hypothetical protein